MDGFLSTAVLFFICLLPLVLGFGLGWALRARVLALGWPWALLPGWVKQLWEGEK